MDSANPYPTVTGFMTPMFVDKARGGRTGYVNAFADPADIERIAAGYACGNCCATFSIYHATCPVCGTTRDVNLDVKKAPADWQAYWDEHNYGSGTTETNTMEDALKAIAESPDVEHIPVQKLSPSKFGRGRPT
jgi:hypothetical protein